MCILERENQKAGVWRPNHVGTSGFQKEQIRMMGNFWACIWISVSLGTRTFLCFAREWLGEKKTSAPPKLGTLLIKTFFCPHLFPCYACAWGQAANPQTAWLQYYSFYFCICLKFAIEEEKWMKEQMNKQINILLSLTQEIIASNDEPPCSEPWLFAHLLSNLSHITKSSSS